MHGLQPAGVEAPGSHDAATADVLQSLLGVPSETGDHLWKSEESPGWDPLPEFTDSAQPVSQSSPHAAPAPSMASPMSETLPLRERLPICSSDGQDNAGTPCKGLGADLDGMVLNSGGKQSAASRRDERVKPIEDPGRGKRDRQVVARFCDAMEANAHIALTMVCHCCRMSFLRSLQPTAVIDLTGSPVATPSPLPLRRRLDLQKHRQPTHTSGLSKVLDEDIVVLT